MAEELKVDIDGKTIATAPVSEPTAKTYPEEYVKAVREEAKENRIARKAVEAKLKKLIGLKDDEDIDDAKISAYQTAQQTQLSAARQNANDKLLLAEIKGLEGYDPKLVARLLDKSKVTIADDGTVTGLKEAVEALATEFPQVKKMAAAGGGANPPGANGALTPQQEYDEAYAAALKNPRDSLLRQKVFALKERLR